MPTGYTAAVEDGTVTDFRTFALRCARAFGATVMQRDDPLTELPKPRTVDEHYPRRVTQARQRIAELSAMTVEEAERQAAASYQKRTEEVAASQSRIAVEDARYQAMLDQVEAWTPPTDEHVGLKTFMLQQLRDSMHGEVQAWLRPPERKTGRQWLAEEIEHAGKDLAYAEKALREEEERAAGATAWIQALYESLEGQTVR